MKMKLLLVILIGLLFGCNSGGGGGKDSPLTVEITGWYMENADESAVSKYGDTANATAYFHISLKVDDPDGIDDVIYVEVSNPKDRYWILRDSSSGIDLYDPENKRFIANGRWSTVYPNSIILGQYTAFVLDSDGNSATNTIDFSSPGTTFSEEGFIYSEDYKGVTDGGIEMLKRASITNYEKGEDSITIEFQVDDTRVFNGYVWIYDGWPEYVTRSDYFINTINYGSGIFKDGTINTLVIQSSDLDLGSYTWDDIDGFHVLLTDGVQYSPKETWDHRSVSQYKTFVCADDDGPEIMFTPVDWGIELDTHGAGIHTISMVADVLPLEVDDLQRLGGVLIWEETEIILCAAHPPEEQDAGISVRGIGDGFLRIGDVFQSNAQNTEDCRVDAQLQEAFDDYGLPITACLSVMKTCSDKQEFCAPLDEI